MCCNTYISSNIHQTNITMNQSQVAIKVDNIDKADTWWRTMGGNPLTRIIAQGELTTKYHSFDRIPSSLTSGEIYDIYMRETTSER